VLGEDDTGRESPPQKKEKKKLATIVLAVLWSSYMRCNIAILSSPEIWRYLLVSHLLYVKIVFTPLKAMVEWGLST
jgi:hypothetical protein